MSWLSVTIATDAQHADALSDALFDLGALSTSIEDAHAGTDSEQPIFGEPGEPSDTVWEASHVIALFDEGTDVASLVAQAVAQCGIAPPAFQTVTVEEQDWVRATQAQFDPIRISDRLWITPTWHQPPNPDAINLQLDPGLAFGTGSHPTTRLCLQWLDRHLAHGETVLDYGCGSGILAIAAKKLGAGDCLGVDIDPQAIVASNQNAEQNQVVAQFCLPDAMPKQTYDIVVANILTNPLRMLAPLLAGSCRAGGRIALSGILENQAQEIIDIYSAWFDLDEPVFDDGWTCVSGTKTH
ncbi:ribosomal protein L11 methyltransferase [Chitinivorax tropicus]|uniref:Ribosomal protein L11 methyltransferase n=1 Tax=Chitinivorax tropicus TaxID=714531 RepID=A0A840ML65_9PROT|nr:50S ribosomal protein L11 methyltransferase [Chitinivorax tropicus]MBB5017452.1 ribosomal protein L11 methyltransferase [Chitinivorax tropicus]